MIITKQVRLLKTRGGGRTGVEKTYRDEAATVGTFYAHLGDLADEFLLDYATVVAMMSGMPLVIRNGYV